MKRIGAAVGLLAALGVMGGLAVRGRAPAPERTPPLLAEFTPEELEKILQHSPLGPTPGDPTNRHADEPEAAVLGQRIFFDPRFSRDGKVSCSTCHVPGRGFGDGQALSNRFPLERNVPSLWNVAYNRWFFWDGRSDSLWSQALKPLENPREQGGTRLQFVHLMEAASGLRAGYERIFGPLPDFSDLRRYPASGTPAFLPPGSPQVAAWHAMTPGDQTLVNLVFANLGKSIAAYERKLTSRRSPFDVFVEGIRERNAAKIAALSPGARRGLKLFVGRANCRLCHSGPNFTDGEFHNIGIPPLRGGLTSDRFGAIEELRKDPFNSRGPFSDDPGEGARKLDYLWVHQDLWGQVKTPTLRNVAKTGPYMHQGQLASLRDVVRFYSTLQGMVLAGHHERSILVPLALLPEEAASLVEFLESLTDEAIDEGLLRPLP